jgi:hypothetical protein
VLLKVHVDGHVFVVERVDIELANFLVLYSCSGYFFQLKGVGEVVCDSISQDVASVINVSFYPFKRQVKRFSFDDASEE